MAKDMTGTGSAAARDGWRGRRRMRSPMSGAIPWPWGAVGAISLVGAAFIWAVGGIAPPAGLGMAGVGLAVLVAAGILRGSRSRTDEPSLLHAFHGPAFLTDRDGRVLEANAVARAQFGAAPGQELGTALTHLSGEAAGRISALLDAMRGNRHAVSRLGTGLGHREVTVVRGAQGRLLWLLDAVAHSRHTGLSASGLPEFVADAADGTVSAANDALVELCGRAPARIGDIVADPPLCPGRVHSLAGSTGAALIVDAGATGPGRRYVAVPCDAIAVAGSAMDQFFDVLPVALARLRPDGTVSGANRMARALLAHSMNGEVRFDALVDGLGRSVSGWIEAALAGRASRKPEIVRASAAATDVYLQVMLHRIRDGDGHGLLAVLSDATELKSLEAQFVQSQKMQAIGQLAGGVAHDFNNLLTAISGHCDLLLLRHDEGDPDYADLIQIHQNANRAASLVGQLLAFSRKQHLNPERLDLRDTLSDLGHLLNRLVGERIALTQDHVPDLAPVRADRRQLEQVIMNLVVNARDAMPDGGSIRISMRNLAIGHAYRRDQAEVPAGTYVAISVTDTGCGIAPDWLSRVFEPFVTTKRPGEGTGLGLSTAYGIVKQTGGFIFVDSTLGEGTTFEVLLPAVEAGPAAEVRRTPDGPPARHGEGVVMLVEDEAPVRAFAARALQMRGYKVIEAENGEQALALLDDPGLAVDVFVTDVVMPGLDGPSWVRRALERRPGTRVVFVSGYAEDAMADHRTAFPNAEFLAKPFSLNDLSATVLRQMT
jgi:two-component system, cell cycle sensor histidine kinase and response regulator CckA